MSAPSMVMVSTYPPTQCGIATFTRSLQGSIREAGGRTTLLRLGETGHEVGLDGQHETYSGLADLPRAWQVLNEHDVVLLQHEFGIYGGSDGVEVLDLVAGCKTPIITVAHTVLAAPTGHQRHVFQSLLDRSTAVVTLSGSARKQLLRHYSIAADRVHVIPHGADDLRNPHGPTGARGVPRILTWGLMSPGKGLEWGIQAIAHLDDLPTPPHYIIAGLTHPKVAAVDGERYRQGLQQLAERLGVADRVHFLNEYLEPERLRSVIASASAYLLPYDTTEQVTSGVLVEALVAGGPVISTRFPHAEELLAFGRGLLVRQQDPVSMARAIRQVCADEVAAARMRRLAIATSVEFLWPAIGKRYIDLGRRVLGAQVPSQSGSLARHGETSRAASGWSR